VNAKVIRILSDTNIQLDRKWTFHDMNGGRVHIAGLLPAEGEEKKTAVTDLVTLLLNKEVTLRDFLYVSSDLLFAVVTYNSKPVQDYFPSRKIPTLEPSRWLEPDETQVIDRVFGGVPIQWSNPIADLPVHLRPYLGNARYPTKPWDRDYPVQHRIVEALFTDSHGNRKQLDEWFRGFLEMTECEAPLLLVGPVGVGKSWWLAHKLMKVDPAKYHAILIDLRHRERGDRLEQSIHYEINEFLNYYIHDMSWLDPDFKAIYGSDFDPDNEEIRAEMRKRAVELSAMTKEYNLKRLRWYNRKDHPELIVAFDNIDHYTEPEQAIVLDLCHRILGNPPGVKVMVAIRPTTQLPKSRAGAFYGESILPAVYLQSPDIYVLLAKRLATTGHGSKIEPSDAIPNAGALTWEGLLHAYRQSDNAFGLAGLVRQLCSTEKIELPTTSRKSHTSEAGTYDVRHYLRLFNRVLLSDTLGSLSNIGNIYFGIHALVLPGEEPMEEGRAYLYNLFDNGYPERRGNALARYRVLEYCALFHDLGEAFDVFCGALGIGERTGRDLIHRFADAGLIEIDKQVDKDDNVISFTATPTVPGRRHFELTTNLWYMICVKTGMHIYKNMVLYDEEAWEKASEFVTSTSVLEFYATRGWVPEEAFIDFIGLQEILESRRIGEYQAAHPEMAEQIGNMAGQLSRPATNLYYAYREQLHRWQMCRERQGWSKGVRTREN
jgi:hypothetical protein